MNYELAKELKEAGFPRYKDIDVEMYESEKQTYFSTLEELIEACGTEIELYVGENTSVANKRGGPEVRCSTPTEAVARLWLALNKHETKL